MLRSRAALITACAALAALWRVVLIPRYWGWEESDYGNLMMTRGVLESGFTAYDMNHLPMYYALSAGVMALVGDAIAATHAVSLLAGVLTVALGVALADRLVGRGVAWAVGAVLIVQPELALYSASALREPVYAAAVLGGLWALSRERLALGSALVGVAFLTRMDALLALSPALALHALGRPGRVVRLGRALGPLALCALAWAAYCAQVYGTWAFWGHSVAVNVETGGAEHPAGLAWLVDGLGVVWALHAQVLPSRLGWGPWLLLHWGLAVAPWGRHDPRRTLAVAALGLLGFWLGVGLVGQHEPGHNLYWKWLHAVVPPLVLVAALGADDARARLERVLGRPAVLALGVLVLGQAGLAMGQETQRQLRVSEQLYRPQVELAQRIEASAPPGAALLVDNIPGCYIDRRPHPWRLFTWMDLPVAPGDWAGFARWARAEDLRFVVWFAEDWTQAPVIAPWLGHPTDHEVEGVRFELLAEDAAYGWILYRVSAAPLGAQHGQPEEQGERAVEPEPGPAERPG